MLVFLGNGVFMNIFIGSSAARSGVGISCRRDGYDFLGGEVVFPWILPFCSEFWIHWAVNVPW